MPPIPQLDNNGQVKLDVSGIVGFLGGDEAISAMESVHFYKYRRFLGFYNTPGSYKVAKHYGRLARGYLWDALYPGVNDDPAKFLKLDGENGPDYRGIVSGTVMPKTGHIGHIFAEICKDKAKEDQRNQQQADDQRRSQQDSARLQGQSQNADEIKETRKKGFLVSIVDFQSADRDQTKDQPPTGTSGTRDAALATAKKTRVGAWTCGLASIFKRIVNPNYVALTGGKLLRNSEASDPNLVTIPHAATFHTAPWRYIIGFATCILNVGLCVTCGIFRDWYAFGLILWGILANGLACFIIGSAKIRLDHHKPSPNSPPGNGVMSGHNHFIVLRGKEEEINHIVKGNFKVDLGGDASYNQIGISAALLTLQFLAQLFVTPQASLFGQFLFLASLAISWLNNACLSGIDKESFQKRILEEALPLSEHWVKTRRFEKRTEAAVFAVLSGFPRTNDQADANSGDEVGGIRNVTVEDEGMRNAKAAQEKTIEEKNKRYISHFLSSTLPTGTVVWETWNNMVTDEVFKLVVKKADAHRLMEAEVQVTLNADEEKLLKELLGNAKRAMDEYLQVHT